MCVLDLHTCINILVRATVVLYFCRDARRVRPGRARACFHYPVCSSPTLRVRLSRRWSRSARQRLITPRQCAYTNGRNYVCTRSPVDAPRSHAELDRRCDYLSGIILCGPPPPPNKHDVSILARRNREHFDCGSRPLSAPAAHRF